MITIMLIIACYILPLIKIYAVADGNTNVDKYRIILSSVSPSSPPLCCHDDPFFETITTVSSPKIQSPLDCGLRCTQFNLTGGANSKSSCSYFNYRPNSCQMYSGEYACFNTSVTIGCALYQRVGYYTALKNCFGLEKISPTVEVADCIFPFTHNGEIFYNCTRFVVNLTNPCNQSVCLNYARKIVLCSDPENFNGTNHTSNWAIPNQVPTYLGYSIFDWLVIMQRKDRLYNFYQNWASYKAGFGSFPLNFWMGHEKVYQLTNTAWQAGKPYSFRLEYFLAGVWVTDEWTSFYLDPEINKYTLHLAGYFGDSGYDILSRTDSSFAYQQNNRPFSTFDKDSTGAYKCATFFITAGWFSSCCHMDFFGSIAGFDTWFYNDWIQIQTLRMMIRQY